jgi:hypothetical protein
MKETYDNKPQEIISRSKEVSFSEKNNILVNIADRC